MLGALAARFRHVRVAFVVTMLLLGVTLVTLMLETNKHFEMLRGTRLETLLYSVAGLNAVMLAALAAAVLFLATQTRDLRERERALIESEGRLAATVPALREALEGAEEATRAKARFLAIMSHEIRTPLNGVLGALALLENTALASEQKLYVATATRSGEALLNLISDILDLSKMEAGKLELDAVDFPFRQLIDDVTGILAPAARRHANTLEISIDPAIPEYVTGDLGRLRQVLLNFGSNAIKFTTRGKVGINARLIGGTAEFPEVEIAVTDTGIGIPAHRLKDLFQDFSMVDDSYRRKVGGTGLGLAISHRLVGLMRGHTGVESVEGLGSRFWFTVSLATAQAADEILAPGLPEKPARAMSILLVEDNPTNLMVASRILAAEGHEVTTALDGCEAVEAVRTRRFDAVLMDISMPEMDGMEATRLIRSLPVAHARLPIIAMTAHALAEDRARFLAAGMDHCLTKPLRRPQLQAALAGADAQCRATGSVPHGGQADLPLLSMDDLSTLEADMTPELLPVILRQFLQEIMERSAETRRAAETGAHERFRKAVHAVAGSAATIGAQRLASLARRIERQCLDGNPEAAMLEADDFTRLFNQTAEMLKDFLANHAAARNGASAAA